MSAPRSGVEGRGWAGLSCAGLETLVAGVRLLGVCWLGVALSILRMGEGALSMPVGSVEGLWLRGGVVPSVAFQARRRRHGQAHRQGLEDHHEEGPEGRHPHDHRPLTATGRAAKHHGSELKIKATLTVAHRIGTATATVKA